MRCNTLSAIPAVPENSDTGNSDNWWCLLVPCSHSQQRGRPCNLWHSTYDASYIGARLVSGGPQTQSGRTATSHPFPEFGARPGLHEFSAEAEGDLLFHSQAL